MSIADRQKLTDRAKPKPLELTEKAKAQIEKLTRQLERQGVSADNAGVIAEKVAVNAEGPIALDDWMTLDASRFSEQTKATLGEQGMTADKVLDAIKGTGGVVLKTSLDHSQEQTLRDALAAWPAAQRQELAPASAEPTPNPIPGA